MVAAISVPGPIEPQGTAHSPNNPMTATLRADSPQCTSKGMPMVMPMPNPVSDSANGVTPCTTSSTAPTPLPVCLRIHCANTFCAPATRNTSDNSRPPPTISSTSISTGIQTRTACMAASPLSGNPTAMPMAASTTPSIAACSDRTPENSATMTATTGSALQKSCISPTHSNFACASLFAYSKFVKP